MSEKEDLELHLQIHLEKADVFNENRQKEDARKYEKKNRNLKELFQLYCKNGKEIFEAQQHGNAMVSIGGILSPNTSLCTKEGCCLPFGITSYWISMREVQRMQSYLTYTI